MAEKYGTIPKRFTKEWFDYVWYYYKWRFLGILLAVLCIVVTVYQCTHQVKYDMTILYAGKMQFAQEAIDHFRTELEQQIEDINHDGKVLVDVQQYNFADVGTYREYDYGIQTKIDASLAMGDTFLFLFDSYEADNMLKREHLSELYVPVQEYAKNTDHTLDYDSGLEQSYGLNLKNSQFLKKIGMVFQDDLYLVVHQNYSDKKDRVAGYEQALKIAAMLSE